jgi:basic amino acid/polyamine antiporter, APA family
VITVYNDITNYINDRQPVVNSLLGIVIVALGIPFYFYYRSRNKKEQESLTE